MDRRAVRLALGLTIAGALMLTAGVATWLITTLGRVTSGLAPATCGSRPWPRWLTVWRAVGMGLALARATAPGPAASRSRPEALGPLPGTGVCGTGPVPG
jgi:hypothetical protein